ncbi:cytochrome c550 [Bacillus sp. Marseille-P3661]|uniref:cytochrome c550 n=1 Tax=Bacillus sp. Marseille-P3661 TaxID=1936234 RepID=UPI000C852FC4|nr:cytochrome c [Bacillus sp. Marseille-P3661]
MNRNPLMPFLIIAVLGLVLTVGISFFGLNNAEKMLAGGDEAQEEQAGEVAADDGEGLFKASCASCHGQNLEGGVGPSLETIGASKSAEEIANIINNGQGSMPPGLVDAAKAETIAAWLAEHK